MDNVKNNISIGNTPSHNTNLNSQDVSWVMQESEELVFWNTK